MAACSWSRGECTMAGAWTDESTRAGRHISASVTTPPDCCGHTGGGGGAEPREIITFEVANQLAWDASRIRFLWDSTQVILMWIRIWSVSSSPSVLNRQTSQGLLLCRQVRYQFTYLGELKSLAGTERGPKYEPWVVVVNAGSSGERISRSGHNDRAF